MSSFRRMSMGSEMPNGLLREIFGIAGGETPRSMDVNVHTSEGANVLVTGVQVGQRVDVITPSEDITVIVTDADAVYAEDDSQFDDLGAEADEDDDDLPGVSRARRDARPENGRAGSDGDDN